MPLTINHNYVSSIGESTQSGIPGGWVGPTEWNDSHKIVGSTYPPMVDTGIVYVPGLTNGFSYTIPDNIWHVVINGTMSISTGTFVMPAHPIDGQVIRLKTMQTLRAIDVQPNAGQIVNDHPGILPAFTYFEATYDLANTTWYIEYFSGALITLTQPLTLYVCILAGTIVGGSSYTSGGSDPVAGYSNVSLTGGSGTGATADILVTAGVVTDVVPRSQGAGYLIGDVLSANAADIGGTGAGFTFTLTGVGTDLQKGTTLGTAFRTLNRAFQEIASFNLAPGFAVQVNISDGLYDEQLYQTIYVGSFSSQITWNGNLTRRENVRIRPSSNVGGAFTRLSVLGFNGAVGPIMQGLWIDGTNGGFGGWQPVAADASTITFDTCRLSLLPDDGWSVYFFGFSAVVTINNNTYDMSGQQSNFASYNNATLIINGTQTLIPDVSNLTWIAGNAFTFEILDGADLIINNNPNNFINFTLYNGPGGTGGSPKSISLQVSSRVLLLVGDPAAIPGDGIAYFRDVTCAYGALYNTFPPTDLSTQLFGAVFNGPTLPVSGAGSKMVVQDSWGIFDTTDSTTNRWTFSFNDNGTARHVLLSSITLDYNYNVPVNGFSLTLGNKDGRVILDPAGALLTGTVVMCSVPYDGQEVRVQTSQAITGLTVSPNAGQSVVAPPTTLAAGAKFTATYRSTNTSWYCAV